MPRFENGADGYPFNKANGMTLGEFQGTEYWASLCTMLDVNEDNFATEVYNPNTGEWSPTNDDTYLEQNTRVRFVRSGGTKGLPKAA